MIKNLIDTIWKMLNILNIESNCIDVAHLVFVQITPSAFLEREVHFVVVVVAADVIVVVVVMLLLLFTFSIIIYMLI